VLIGILDAGTAGLALARMVRDRLPGHDCLYFGDTAAAPLGDRSMGTLRDRLQRGLAFLWHARADLVVIASHSLASAALSTSALHLPPGVPLLDIVTAAGGAAAAVASSRAVGVAGSRATIAAAVHARIIAEANSGRPIFSVACPLLEPLVAEGWRRRPETTMILKKYLHPLKMRQIDTLIPAFGAYPLLRDQVQRKIGRRVRVIDPQVCLVESLTARVAGGYPSGDPARACLRVFLSDITPQVEESARLYYGANIRLDALPPGMDFKFEI